MRKVPTPGQPLGLASTAELGLVERLRQRCWFDAADLIERQAVQINGLKFDALGEPRTRYVRVTLNNSHCVMRPSEGDCHVEEARNSGDPDWDKYIVRDVWLSEREFENLPEFVGF